MSANADYDCSSMVTASSMIIFGNSLLDSMALMHLPIIFAWYSAFNDCINPWSIGCVTEIVFGSIKSKSGTCWWAGQLSTINPTLQLWARHFRSSCLIHSMKMSESIQLFFCALYMHGKDFTFLKHLGCLLFPMTSSGSFSSVALAVLILMSLTLCVYHQCIFHLLAPEFRFVVLARKDQTRQR